jgi:hypothetical protein
MGLTPAARSFGPTIFWNAAASAPLMIVVS